MEGEAEAHRNSVAWAKATQLAHEEVLTQAVCFQSTLGTADQAASRNLNEHCLRFQVALTIKMLSQ